MAGLPPSSPSSLLFSCPLSLHSLLANVLQAGGIGGAVLLVVMVEEVRGGREVEVEAVGGLEGLV